MVYSGIVRKISDNSYKAEFPSFPDLSIPIGRSVHSATTIGEQVVSDRIREICKEGGKPPEPSLPGEAHRQILGDRTLANLCRIWPIAIMIKI